MSGDTNFRLAEDTDKDQILALLNQVFESQQRTDVARGDSFWEWKYITNPFGKSILSVAEIEGRIVSVANLWPWEFSCRGAIIKALQACDSVVDENYRGKGLFKLNRMHGIEIAKEKDYKFIFNFPNENSLPAYKSLGWEYLGKIDWWVKILKPITVFKGMRGNSISKPFEIPDRYRIDINRLDEISDQSVSYDGYMKTYRKAGFYEWRFLKHPSRDYGLINIDRGRKKSSAIFTINQNGVNREMVVVDFIGSESNYEILVKEIVKCAKDLDASFIALMNNFQFATDNLWKSGFIKKKNKNMTVLPLDITLESKITQPKNWALNAMLHDSI